MKIQFQNSISDLLKIYNLSAYWSFKVLSIFCLIIISIIFLMSQNSSIDSQIFSIIITVIIFILYGFIPFIGALIKTNRKIKSLNIDSIKSEIKFNENNFEIIYEGFEKEVIEYKNVITKINNKNYFIISYLNKERKFGNIGINKKSLNQTYVWEIISKKMGSNKIWRLLSRKL